MTDLIRSHSFERKFSRSWGGPTDLAVLPAVSCDICGHRRDDHAYTREGTKIRRFDVLATGSDDAVERAREIAQDAGLTVVMVGAIGAPSVLDVTYADGTRHWAVILEVSEAVL